MSALADWQRRFVAALRDPGAEADADLGQAAGLDVYRNNVRQSLTEALAIAFPHTRVLLGERYFAAAAGDYARDHPPGDPRLASYGTGFADFLDDLPPLADHRYVSDICRLERARLDVSHAAETPLLEAERLAAHPDPESLRVTTRAATSLVACRHDVEELWRHLERDGVAAPLGERGGMAWLVVRRGARVEPLPVSPASAELYRALEAAGPRNQALGMALSISADAHGQAAAGEALGTLLGAGSLAMIEDGRDEEDTP
ncbi:HvfC/BufC N-terminal domain-containing protein [Halomonas borealis]|uniref:HvfC/BufC N-terminal domain-containing protein n=1 Tax=Halomonas borealis TaxID=2508710 RepID=UPI0014487878|nr:DNA-binding domain-containing protein [Halomonas borealis]